MAPNERKKMAELKDSNRLEEAVDDLFALDDHDTDVDHQQPTEEDQEGEEENK